MDTELMNAYIQKQNRLIGELINKNLMLDSQLEIAMAKLKKFEESKTEDTKEDKAYK
jgi:hypothetical protein